MQDLLLDRYQIIETAGKGGFGTVLHGFDTRLKREVAIKTVELAPEITTAEIKKSDSEPIPEMSIPGLDEARAAGKLSNANIVTIYDCVVEGGKAYVIEEYVEGITLTQLMDGLGDDITLDMIAEVFRGVSNAISAAHKKNILHLDIKPDNVLIGRGGEVKVADFGLATLMDMNGEGVASAGTIGYMPPEQMKKVTLDVRSDEWSLAMIVYELLTGKNPVRGAPNIEKALEVMNKADFVVPSSCWEALSEEVDDIIFDALSLNQGERFETVKMFSDALKPYLGDARAGKRELAKIVNGNEDAMIDTSTGAISQYLSELENGKELLVDRLGKKGLKIISRLVCAASCVFLCAVGLLNFRWYGIGNDGLFVGFMPVCVVVLAIVAALSVWKPRIMSFVSLIFLSIVVTSNFVWVGAIILSATVLWWWFVGRYSEISTFCVLLSPLTGAVGFASVAQSFCGGLLNWKECIGSVLCVVALAICFASFGSNSIFGWDFAKYGTLTFDLSFANSVNMRFLSLLSSPLVWIEVACWVAGSVVFSLCCMRGNLFFDVVGSLVSGGLLVFSSLVGIIFFGEVAQSMNIISCLVSAVISFLISFSSLANRARNPIS